MNGNSRRCFYQDVPELTGPGEAGLFPNYHLAAGFIGGRVEPGREYRLLDMGFGTVDFLRHITGKHPDVAGYGCDVTVSRAVSNGPTEGFELLEADLNECAALYPDSFFDFIVAAEIIEHLENTDNLLIQARRYLKEGGYLIITTPNLAAWYERLLLLFGMEPLMAEVSFSSRIFGKRLLYRLMGKTESPAVGHLRLFTPAALREMCEYHGFEFVEHRGYHTVELLPNRLMTRLYKNMAQGIFMAFRK